MSKEYVGDSRNDSANGRPLNQHQYGTTHLQYHGSIYLEHIVC